MIPSTVLIKSWSTTSARLSAKAPMQITETDKYFGLVIISFVSNSRVMIQAGEHGQRDKQMDKLKLLNLLHVYIYFTVDN